MVAQGVLEGQWRGGDGRGRILSSPRRRLQGFKVSHQCSGTATARQNHRQRTEATSARTNNQEGLPGHWGGGVGEAKNSD